MKPGKGVDDDARGMAFGGGAGHQLAEREGEQLCLAGISFHIWFCFWRSCSLH